MGRLTELIPTRFAQECATAGFIDSCKRALGELAGADSLPTALGVLGGVAGGPLAFLGIYAGGAFLKWKSDARQAQSAKAEFRALRARLGEIEDAVTGQKELAGLLDELLRRDGELRTRLEQAERAATSPQAAFESVLASTLTQLTKDTDENFDNVRIFLSNISTWVVEGFDRIETILLSGRAQLPTIPANVRHNLAAAGVRPNPDFVGRADLLVRLHAALASDGVAALTHALSADGGVGKTETAIAYVFDAEFAATWEGIWWLDAAEVSESEHGIEDELLRTRLPDSLRTTLAVMGYQCRPDETPDEMLLEFVRRLGDGRHLVVIDNVDSVEVLRRVNLPEGSRMLATTRLHGRAIPGTLATTLEVDLLEPEDSAQLLVKHRDDLRDPETGLPTAEARQGVMAIVEHLDGHALAVALAASALRYDEGESPESLLDRLRAAELGQEEHAYAELDDDATGRKYGRKVAATLLLHLPELEKRDPLVGPVLLAASLCHNAGIPPSLLAACIGAEPEPVRKTLLRLRDRSIVRFDGAAGAEKRGLAGLHRLTQSAVRGRAGPEAAKAKADAVERALNGVFDDCAIPERWPVQTEALPHALSIFDSRPKKSTPSARLHNQVAFLLQTLGRAAEAEPIYEEALAMTQRLRKGDHADVATSLNNLAGVKKTLGRVAKSEPLFEEALAMRKRLFKGDHPALASSLNNLAGVKNTLGRAAEAEPIYEEALAMYQRLFKGDHPDVARSLNNLAGVKESLGRAAEAEPIYEEALAMRKRLFKGDHPDVARSLNGLAAVKHTLGRAAEAEPVYEEGLAMRQRLFKGDHPDVASSLNNLAGVKNTLGRAAEAEPIYEQALAMTKRLFKGDHPDVALSLNNLASERETLGRAAEAEPLFEEALAMHQRLFKGDHPDVAWSLNNLASVRQTLGRAAEAEPIYEEALDMYKRLFKGDHPDVALSLNNLAFIRGTLGKWDEALGLSEEAVAMGRRCLPEGHPLLASWERNLAFIRKQLGRG